MASSGTSFLIKLIEKGRIDPTLLSFNCDYASAGAGHDGRVIVPEIS